MTDSEKLSMILEKVDSLDGKVSSLDGKVNSLDEKVNGLDKKVGSLDKKVDSLDKKVSNLDEKVSSLDEKVGSLDKKVNSLDKKTDSLEVGLGEVKQRVIKTDVIVENEIRVNIQRVAEGHLDLSRKLNECIKLSSDIKDKQEIQDIYINMHNSKLKAL